MPRELILHIGTSKTGSTSIQNVLSSHRAEMAAQGAYWPATPGAKRHVLLAMSNSSNERFYEKLGNPLWQGMEPTVRIATYRTEFVQEMEQLGDEIDRVVVSAEQFSEVLQTKAEITRLHAMLAPHFDKMTVVIYLRRQDSHYSSMYAQMLRIGNVGPPNLAGVKICFNHDYDYLDVLNRWAAVFGEAAMQPRLFESSGAARFDVVDDFLAVCRLKLSLSEDDHKRSRNPSMTRLGQLVLNKTGETLRARPEGKAFNGPLWNRVADAVTQALPGEGWLPTRQEAEAFMARFAVTNEAVRKRWFPERDTLFAADFTRLPQQHRPPDPESGFTAACAALLEAAGSSLKREAALLMQIVCMANAAGDHERAKATLLNVLRTDVGNIPARIMLAEHHMARGNYKAARACCNAASKIAPNDRAVRKLDQKLAGLGHDGAAKHGRAPAQTAGGGAGAGWRRSTGRPGLSGEALTS